MTSPAPPKIALLTAGGIAPCLSAAVGYLIADYSSAAPEAEIIGYRNGYMGLLQGHSVTIGGELFSDAMGKAGTMRGTYVGMVLHNVDTVVKALGGGVPDERPGRLGAWASQFKE